MTRCKEDSHRWRQDSANRLLLPCLLAVTWFQGSGQVVVSVRDTGVGVRDADMGRIFEPFYTTKPQGLGMGLAICRSIIEAHEGAIWVTPNADRGVTFSFSLPAYRETTP